MKKIVALVLCLVLALSLCTVAFAEADKYDLYQTTSANYAGGKLTSDASATVTNEAISATTEAVAYSDGSGKVATLTIKGTMYAKTTAPTTNSYAVTLTGKTDILYYVNVVTQSDYLATGSVFTDFGTKKDQVYIAGTTTKTFFKITDGPDAYEDNIYIKDANGNMQFLVDGEIVSAFGPAVQYAAKGQLVNEQLVAANYVVTGVAYKNNKTVPTEVTEMTTGTKYTTIVDAGKAAAGSKVYNLTAEGYANYDVVLTAAGTASDSSTTVESAKTFDAGIALYAGMALASVAGSAVVIGKKKEF